MKIEMSESLLVHLVTHQLTALFLFDEAGESELLSKAIELSLRRCEFCFGHSRNKYYFKQGSVYFNPYHSGQYSIFLYFLSHEIYRIVGSGNTLSDRVYYLNKALNGIDLFYEVEMPRVFFLDHPVGSVLGRATYGEGFSVSQNCTVGNNKGRYPTFGRNVKMMSGAKVLGHCSIGSNVILSANTYVKDCDIAGCSLVFGSSPNLIIKAKDEEYFKHA